MAKAAAAHATDLASATSATLRAVSLFSNCGAGDLGFAQAGFKFDVLAELEPDRLAVAALNHPGAECVPGDLRSTLSEVVSAYRRKGGSDRVALLAACPPCQGMSTAQSERGKQHDADVGSSDPRNLLVSVIADAVALLRPRAVIVENVPAFLRRLVRHPKTGDPISAARLLVDSLPDYAVFPLQTDLADFGVPQRRRRAFLTFIDRDEDAVAFLRASHQAPYPVPTHVGRHVTVAAALAELSAVTLDSRDATSAQGDDPLHFVSVLPQHLYKMVAAIPPRSGASAWMNSACSACGAKAEDPEAATCERCALPLPRPVVRDKDGNVRLVNGFRRSSYRRMHPDQPAATVTTASGRISSDLTLHPWENRVLSPLECQHLQTFPRAFRWGTALADHGVMKLRAMIGEAVPPLFTKLHGAVLASVLEGRSAPAVDEADVRVRVAMKALGLSPLARA